MIKKFFLKILNGVDRIQAESALSSKDREIDAAKNNNALLKDLLDKTKEELNHKILSLESDKELLRKDKQSLQSELTSKNDLIKRFNDDKASIIKELNHYKHELDVTKKTTKQRIDSCAHTITELRNKINSENDEFSKFKEQSKILEGSLKKENEELLSILNKANSQVSSAINEKNLAVNESKRLKDELEKEKELAKKNVDSSNQTISELRAELESLKKELEESRKETKDKQNLIISKDKDISILNERIKGLSHEKEELQQKLRATSNEIKNTSKPNNEGNNNVNQTNAPTKDNAHENTTSKSLESAETRKSANHVFGSQKMSSSSNDTRELPSINGAQNKAQYASIKAVLDVNHNYQLIWSKNFFNQDAKIVSQVSRDLEIAAQLGKEYFVCACCGTPVKISKRTNTQGSESLFFTHCNHDVKCKWRTVKASSNDFSVDESQKLDAYTPLTIADRVMINSFNKDKETIYEALCSKESEEAGITDVNKNCFINSSIEHLRKRKADLYCKFHGYDLAIELQTGEDYNPKIVNKDIFYRLNKCFVLWIFGAGEKGYSYLLRHVIQNTLFANKGNVFMFDDDARKTTAENHVLTLKFNFVDNDGEWHYKNKENGILVNLNDLKFDDLNTFKPYIVDNSANKDGANEETNDQLKEYVEEIWNRQTDELDVSEDDLIDGGNTISPNGKQLLSTIKHKEITDSDFNRYSLPFGIDLLRKDDKLYFENDKSLSFDITEKQSVSIETLNNNFEIVLTIEEGSVIRKIYVQKEEGVYYLDKDECVFHCFKDGKEERVCYCKSFRIDKYGNVISQNVNSGKYGIMSLDGSILLGHVYNEIKEWTPLIYRVKNTKGLWGLRNIKGKIIQPCVFNSIDDIKADYTSATIIDGSSTLMFTLTSEGEVIEKEEYDNYLSKFNNSESNEGKYSKIFNELDTDYQSGIPYIGVVMDKEGKYYKVKLADNRVTYILRNQVLSKVKHAMHVKIEIQKNSYDQQRKLTNWDIIGVVTEKVQKNNLWDEFAKARRKKENKGVVPNYQKYIGRIFEFQIVGSTNYGDYKLIPSDGTKIEGLLNRHDADRRYFNGDVVRAKVVRHLYSWCYQVEEKRSTSIDFNQFIDE